MIIGESVSFLLLDLHSYMLLISQAGSQALIIAKMVTRSMHSHVTNSASNPCRETQLFFFFFFTSNSSRTPRLGLGQIMYSFLNQSLWPK